MALLLYKSKEMFSTTELIRKSKMIFDKIVDEEIEKAIIMRDGKPGFLLMDFEKYESIMAEYENLKIEYENLSKEKTKKKKSEKNIKIKSKEEKKLKKKEKQQQVEEEPTIRVIEPKFVEPNKPETKKIEVKKPSIMLSKATHTTTSDLEQKKVKEPVVVNIPVAQEMVDMKKIKPTSKKDETKDEESEVKEALGKIENLNFSDEEKQKVEAQIKERIKIAREERAKELEEISKKDNDDLKEELELQVQLKKVKKKKEQELNEFWN